MAPRQTPKPPLGFSEEAAIMEATIMRALSEDIRSASILLGRLPPEHLCGLIAAHLAARRDIAPARLEALSNVLGRQAWETARRGRHD